MTRESHIIVRVKPDEKERLRAEATRRGVSMSEVLRDYIKRLPKPQAASISDLAPDS